MPSGRRIKGLNRLILAVFSTCKVYRSEIYARKGLRAVPCGDAADVELAG